MAASDLLNSNINQHEFAVQLLVDSYALTNDKRNVYSRVLNKRGGWE